MPGDTDDLQPSIWKDINEAVGEALGVSPPDAAQDRNPETPPEGVVRPKLVPGQSDEITVRTKEPGQGVQYEQATGQERVARPSETEVYDSLEAPPPIPTGAYTPGPKHPVPIPRGTPVITAVEARRVFIEEEEKKARAALEALNRRQLSEAMPVFHPADGSLLGEYAPLQGDAVTPDTVDGLWWLGLPEQRAIWELGINPKDYPRVHRDISVAAAMMLNRRAQTGVYIPLVIRRRKRRLNAALFQGGTLRRIKGINPNDFPRYDPDPPVE